MVLTRVLILVSLQLLYHHGQIIHVPDKPKCLPSVGHRDFGTIRVGFHGRINSRSCCMATYSSDVGDPATHPLYRGVGSA